MPAPAPTTKRSLTKSHPRACSINVRGLTETSTPRGSAMAAARATKWPLRVSTWSGAGALPVSFLGVFWRRAFAAAPSASAMTIYSPGFRLGWRRTGTSSTLADSLRPAPRLCCCCCSDKL